MVEFIRKYSILFSYVLINVNILVLSNNSNSNNNVDEIYHDRFLQQQYFECEKNTGPNLEICQRSNNSTHACCLAISRNGNSPNACGPVPKNETQIRENTSYYFNGENYFLRCLSANNTGSNWVTEVQTDFEYETGISNFTNFSHNCGNYNPYLFRDCEEFSDKTNLCCMVTVNAPGNKFQICTKMPLDSDNLVIGQLTLNCKDEYTVKFVKNVKIHVTLLLILAFLFYI